MATTIVYTEGFDTVPGLASGLRDQWGWALSGNQQGDAQVATTYASRSPGQGLRCHNNSTYTSPAFPGGGITNYVVGFRVSPVTPADAENCSFRLLAADSSVVTAIRVGTDRSLNLYSGATLIVNSAPKVLPGGFNWIDFMATVADSSSYIVKVNGETWMSGTADLKPASQTSVLRFQIFGNQNSTGYWDDIVIGSGDTVIDDVSVKAYYPDGAGYSTQLTPSAGSNYQCVDDPTTAGDTDYVSSSTPGHIDSYTVGNVSGTGSVVAVNVRAVSRKDDAGTRSIRTFARLGGVNVNGTEQFLATAYAGSSTVHNTKPGGGAWSTSDFNSTEIGVEVMS